MEYRIYGQPAKKHTNGGGLVAITAYVGPDARVYGNAQVSGNAGVYGNAEVYGNARVCGNAQVYGDAMVSNPQDLATLTINGINITITKQNAVIGCQCLSHKEWLYMTREQASSFGPGYADLYDMHRDFLVIALGQLT